ncbi:hypothetical protein MPSEU_000270300 [Mayamaea pseudoterrestris]|nr:hypothetical protein MPSEU_000270300 [Mayamaea pseudoterrestris]
MRETYSLAVGIEVSSLGGEASPGDDASVGWTAWRRILSWSDGIDLRAEMSVARSAAADVGELARVLGGGVSKYCSVSVSLLSVDMMLFSGSRTRFCSGSRARDWDE